MLNRFCELIWGKKRIGIFEEVEVKGDDGKWHKVLAKVDTGAYRSCLDWGLAEKWGLIGKKHLKQVWVSNVHGKIKREVYRVKLKIRGKMKEAEINVFDRSKMRYAMIIGRKELRGYEIVNNPEKRRLNRYWIEDQEGK